LNPHLPSSEADADAEITSCVARTSLGDRLERDSGLLEGLGQTDPMDIPHHEGAVAVAYRHDPQLDQTAEEVLRRSAPLR
jgi:hypothetical protein